MEVADSEWKARGDSERRALTLCFCSSVRTSLRTFAHGISSGHQMGLQLSLPQPGFPRPVEYLSISGINARSWAWKTSVVISGHDRHLGCVCVSHQILRLSHREPSWRAQESSQMWLKRTHCFPYVTKVPWVTENYTYVRKVNLKLYFIDLFL